MTQTDAAVAAAREAADAPVLALDVEAIGELGVARWQADFAWPVSDAAFDSLADLIWHGFIALLGRLPPREADLLMADTLLPATILRSLHFRAVEVHCRESGRRLRAAGIARDYVHPDWAKLARRYDLPGGALERWRFRLRGVAKSLAFNRQAGPLSRASVPFRRHRTWNLGSFSAHKTAYLAAQGGLCAHPYWQGLVAPGAAPAPLAPGLAAGIAQLLAEIAGHAARRLGVAVDLTAAGEAWLRRLAVLAGHYDRLHATALPRLLLLSETGNPWHRLISAAVRRQGGQVVGFQHGNEMGVHLNPMSCIAEFGVCDRFVVATATSARWLDALYRASPLARWRPVAFEALPDPQHRSTFAAGRGVALPERIRTVMLMGYPPNWIRYPYFPACYATMRLDLEVRLAKALGEAGVRVIYKAHPQYAEKTAPLFAGLVDRVVGEPLEGTWRQADAFVFAFTGSTTFGFALCTNRPVIVINPAEEAWQPEALALLARRCRLVPAAVDAQNRVQFDAAALRGALAAPVEEPEYAFVEQAMLGGRAQV